jgi:hypothetical protein
MTRRGPSEWASWPDRKLLDLRLCDLDLEIKGTEIEARIQQLFLELREQRIRFRPFFWISVEWFTPDGVPGCAVPFYLLHPRLAELELKQMQEVEGGTPEWCMRILRHETGHAIDNAYRVRRRRRRQRLFGPSSTPYPEFYEPHPYSRSYVAHLEPWYAQSHPDEDFAETFAVWITPHSNWRQRYVNWPVLKKLEYMDELMQEIHSQPPLLTTRKRVEPLREFEKTLRQHYKEKRERYEIAYPHQYDPDLRKLFSARREGQDAVGAADFIARVEREVVAVVAHWTGEYKYIVKQVVKELSDRCKTLDLVLPSPSDQAKRDFTILLTAHTMKYLYKGRNRAWL